MENIRSTINTIEDRLASLNEKVTHEGEEWYESLVGRCQRMRARLEAEEEIDYLQCINDMQIDLNMLFDKVSRAGEEQIHTIETLLDALRVYLREPKPTKLGRLGAWTKSLFK